MFSWYYYALCVTKVGFSVLSCAPVDLLPSHITSKSVNFGKAGGKLTA